MRHALQPDQVRGLQKLQQMFAAPPPPAGRTQSVLPGGAKLELYPGSEDARVAVQNLVAALSQDPGFAALMARTTILVSPPGRGLEAMPETMDVPTAEGVAMYRGPDGLGGPPTLGIRHDSITRWDLGAAHELIHLKLFSMGDAAIDRARAIRERIRLPGSVVDDYANEHEMVAYFGQWTLAGHGDVVRSLSPELADFLHEVLGDVKIRDPGFGRDGARAAIKGLYGWFQTGQKAG